MAKFEKMRNGKWGVRICGAELLAVNAGASTVSVTKRDGSVSRFSIGVMVDAGADGSILFSGAACAAARRGGGNDPDKELA